MSTLLVLKEQIQQIYAKYSMYITKALQFLFGLLLFGTINANIGFMKGASSIICTVGLAAVCAFLPLLIMTLAATALVLVHLYALSMPIAAFAAGVFLLMYIFYFRFTPKRAWVVLIAVLACAYKMPVVLSVAFGLMGAPVLAVPAACGVMAYYLVHLVKVSSTALQGADAGGMISTLMTFAKQAVGNKEMWTIALAVVLGLLVVNAIRTRAVDHAWKIASAAGAVAAVIVGMAGNLALGLHISYAVLIGSGIMAMLVGLVLEFLFFSVDYSGTEHIQFEDDEYYYYVKAVPKVGVAVPEKSVKRITKHQGQETVAIDSSELQHMSDGAMELKRRTANRKAVENSREERAKSTDEILLTRSLSKELGLDEEKQK
ncbi:hypothetical protein [Mediterraneibacter sp. ICN-202921]|uniref:hypothetical protein n=1 Tax=Mediterraneibacter sp. ICN-202921 TaxID=3134657 RepID=UPI0030C618DC